MINGTCFPAIPHPLFTKTILLLLPVDNDVLRCSVKLFECNCFYERVGLQTEWSQEEIYFMSVNVAIEFE